MLRTKSEGSTSRWQLLLAKSTPTLVCLNRLLVMGLEYDEMKKATSRVRYHRFAQSFEYSSTARSRAKVSVYEYLSSCQYKPLWTVFIPPAIGLGVIWFGRALPTIYKFLAHWVIWDPAPYLSIYTATYETAGKLLMVETGARLTLELLMSSGWVHQTLSSLLKYRKFG
jgi:hypothetical protein